MSRRGCHASEGSSLVEVLIATAILATALATLAGLFAGAVETNLTARYRAYTAILAVQKTEELVASRESLGTSAASGDELVDWSGAVARSDSGNDAGVFLRRWRIERNDSGTARIHVEVVRRHAGLLSPERTTLSTMVWSGP
jgi:Tfp pilus assembly protein PilV